MKKTLRNLALLPLFCGLLLTSACDSEEPNYEPKTPPVEEEVCPPDCRDECCYTREPATINKTFGHRNFVSLDSTASTITAWKQALEHYQDTLRISKAGGSEQWFDSLSIENKIAGIKSITESARTRLFASGDFYTGGQNITPYHIQFLKQMGFENVVVCQPNCKNECCYVPSVITNDTIRFYINTSRNFISSFPAILSASENPNKRTIVNVASILLNTQQWAQVVQNVGQLSSVVDFSWTELMAEYEQILITYADWTSIGRPPLNRWTNYDDVNVMFVANNATEGNMFFNHGLFPMHIGLFDHCRAYRIAMQSAFATLMQSSTDVDDELQRFITTPRDIRDIWNRRFNDWNVPGAPRVDVIEFVFGLIARYHHAEASENIAQTNLQSYINRYRENQNNFYNANDAHYQCNVRHW